MEEIIFGLEASTVQGSLAVVRGEEVLAYETWHNPRGRSTAIFHLVEQAIHRFGKPQVLALGRGPGSYNGIRSLFALAEGLSIAFHAVRWGVLSVLAFAHETGTYCVIGDARGGYFWLAQVVNRVLLEPIQLMGVEELLAKVSGVQGFTAGELGKAAGPFSIEGELQGVSEATSRGPILISADSLPGLESPTRGVQQGQLWRFQTFPDARWIVKVAQRELQQFPDSSEAVEPFYLKPVHITPRKSAFP